MEKITIVLADDHDILMDGIESILNDSPNLQVVGKASSATAAEDLVQKLQPDLLLTDISMGEVSGLSLTKNIMFPGVIKQTDYSFSSRLSNNIFAVRFNRVFG